MSDSQTHLPHVNCPACGGRALLSEWRAIANGGAANDNEAAASPKGPPAPS